MSNNEEVGEVPQENGGDAVEVKTEEKTTEENGEEQTPPQVCEYTEEQMERLVLCRTSDDKIIVAPWHLMTQSKTFMQMWENLGMETASYQASSLTATEFEFPLNEITGECFHKILEWMREHHNIPEPILKQDPVTDERTWFKFTDWERQFFDVDFESVKEYYLAANFLDIRSLYLYCAQECARCIMDKSAEQIREMLYGMMELLELTENKAGHAAEIPVSEIDPTKIEQLVEMGFSQSDAVDALMQFSSVLEAAEHIVSMMERSAAATSRTITSAAQPTVTVSSTAPATTVAAATTVATDVVAAATASVISAENSAADQQQQDEDSAAAAAAADADTATPMEEGQSQFRSSTPEADASTSTTAEAGEENQAEDQQDFGKETAQEDEMSFADLKPLTREEFQEMVDLLCREVVGTCLRLVRCSRLVVIGLSELVSVFARDALASSWVDVQFIGSIITELNRHLDELTTTNCDEGEPMMASSDEDKDADVGTDDEELTEQLASLLQLFCQLWQHFPNQKIYKRLNE